MDAFSTTYSYSMDLPPLVPIQSQNLEKQVQLNHRIIFILRYNTPHSYMNKTVQVSSEQFSPQDMQLMEIDQTRYISSLSN